MSNRKNSETTVAEQIKGSADHNDANKAPFVMDGVTDETSRHLTQASGIEDARTLTTVMTLLAQLTTDEREYEDRETGEVRVTNTRQFQRKILLGGIVRNYDFLLEKQEQRCGRAEGAVQNVARGKTADVDGSEQARMEAWAERETDELMALANLRSIAAQEYAEHTGEVFGAAKAAPKAGDQAAVRAAARKAAIAAARG